MDKSIAAADAIKTASKPPAEYPYSPREPTLPPPDPPFELDRIAFHFPALLLATLAVVFSVGNVALLPLMSFFQQDHYGAVWVYFAGGAILAQGGLIATVLVFGTGGFVRRFALCWATAIPLWLCWAGGLMLDTRGYHLDAASELRFGALLMPLAALAIQSPLWFFRLYLGWRLVETSNNETEPPPLSIRDYLTGTAITAFSITCARLAVKPSAIDAEYWTGWSVFFAIAGMISLASVVPAMLLMFRCRHWLVGWTLLVAYGAAAVWLVVGLVAIGNLMFPSVVPAPDLWTSCGISIFFMSFAGFLGLGLKALRDWGWSLILGRRQK